VHRHALGPCLQALQAEQSQDDLEGVRKASLVLEAYLVIAARMTALQKHRSGERFEIPSAYCPSRE
jgi:hypothetical protein